MENGRDEGHVMLIAWMICCKAFRLFWKWGCDTAGQDRDMVKDACSGQVLLLSLFGGSEL